MLTSEQATFVVENSARRRGEVALVLHQYPEIGEDLWCAVACLRRIRVALEHGGTEQNTRYLIETALHNLDRPATGVQALIKALGVERNPE